MLHPSFETLALLHKSFGHLLKNIMIILCKGVIRKCQLVNCESKNLRVVRYLANNLRVNPSASCELYYFVHCFKSRNGSNQICVKGVALEWIFFLEKKCSHNLTNITNITLIRVIRKKKHRNWKKVAFTLTISFFQLPKTPMVSLMWKICTFSISLSLIGSVKKSLHRCYVKGCS